MNVVLEVAKGNTRFNIVVKEDTSLTSIISVEQQAFIQEAGSRGSACRTLCCLGPQSSGSNAVPDCGGGGGGGGTDPATCWPTNPSANWAGYEFDISGCGSVYPTYEITGQWVVPTVKQPPTGCSTTCELGIWVGLEDSLGALDHNLLQAGTSATWDCGIFSCSYGHHLFYEALPAGPVSCLDVSPGATIFVNIYSQYLLSLDGTKKTMFNINVNVNGNKGCLVLSENYFQNGLPYFAPVIVERPAIVANGKAIGLYDLAQFGSITISDCVVNAMTPGAQIVPPANCSDMYTGGLYQRDEMWNSGTQNIGVGPVDSTNSFTETWLTSANT